jgi:hypothetical protein
MAFALRDCPVCKTEYSADTGRLRHNRQTTCSRECSYKFRAKKTTEALTGRPSPLKGKKTGRSSWNKTDGVHINCGHCGIDMRIEPNQVGRKRFCSKACFFSGRELKKTFGKGSAHPAWKDGLSLNKYPSAFNPTLKRKIRTRDGFICQLCEMTEKEHLQKYSRVLVVNHIDFDKQNCAESNLNTLCIPCNTRINWDREKWTAYFQGEMVNG